MVHADDILLLSWLKALKALPSTLLEALENLSRSGALKQVGTIIAEPEAYAVVFVSL
jgi:hypothetical protein